MADPTPHPTPVPAPDHLDAWARVGEVLRGTGYSPRRVAQALGIIAWNGRDMDAPYWRRPNHADGDLRTRVDLLVRGKAVSRQRAQEALPDEAWGCALLECHKDRCRSGATILPLGDDLVLTDRADRAFGPPDGLFLPDSTTLAVRRCLPPDRVDRHLDLGCGGGAVTVLAAHRARSTHALDLNPRAGAAVLRTGALSGVGGLTAWTGDIGAAGALGRFDRVSFVLPLLVAWDGMPSGPVHTVARGSDLLVRLLRLFPTIAREGALLVAYCQAWVGGPPLPEAIDAAFAGRSWRGAMWWDYEADSPMGPLRSGVLALRADASAGWTEAPCEATDVGVDDWWHDLAPLLGEA